MVVRIASLELLELLAGRRAQLGVEVRERLVEQEDLRLADDRARERDPLALAAGELARLAVEQAADAEQVRRPSATFSACSALGTPCAFSGNAMFSRTVRCG